MWLKPALGSVLGQTLADIEVLVYDDGSTDDTWAIIEQSGMTDARIRPLQGMPNRGIVHALATMLAQAKGRYIARMDADDICVSGRLARQLAFLEQHEVDLCGSWFEEFGGGPARPARWPHTPTELEAAMLFQNTICHPTVMARRAVFEAFAYRQDYNLAEDYDLFVRAGARFRLANVPEVLLRYRRHPAQATRARRDRMEELTRRIRLQALAVRGIPASAAEERLHNLIRAPHSINSMADFEAIEAWLLKLISCFEHPDSRAVVASQWTRVAVRAAPLGRRMWRRYRYSPLRDMLGERATGDLDLAVLAALRLDYGSPTFDILRRFGLSA